MNKDDKDVLKAFGLMSLGVILANILFWGGIIWFALWALQKFGVI